MPTVVGVRFKDSGKLYHFEPGDLQLMVGDWAVVETARGPELARVGQAAHEMTDDEVIGEIKPVLRRAGDAEFNSLAQYGQYLDEALQICAERVSEHRLPMRMIKAEYNFDGSRLTFFFTSDKRVDFRLLVRDLARTFHTRIELRQVGPRDEAKLLGGLGPCGRPLCCSTFLPEFAQVSIKMAKDQDLPLNPAKVSGVCGRLLCCLSYEQEQYLEIRAELPAVGAWVQTPEGPGEVVTVNVVRETVTVLLTNGGTLDCTAAQIAGVTDEVAGEARRRTAAGLTPASPAYSAALADHESLAVLADLEDSAPPPSAAPAPSTPRPAPRPMRPEATIAPTNQPRPAPRQDRPDRQPRPERADRTDRADRPARQESAGQRRPPQGQPRPAGPRNELPRPAPRPAAVDPALGAAPSRPAEPRAQSGEQRSGRPGGRPAQPAGDGRGRPPRRNGRPSPANLGQGGAPPNPGPSSGPPPNPAGPPQAARPSGPRPNPQRGPRPAEGGSPGAAPSERPAPGGPARRNKRRRSE